MALRYQNFYGQPVDIRNRQKDSFIHNLGETVLDPKNIGTVLGTIGGGMVGQPTLGGTIGGTLGGMVPGPDFGPEDDQFRSSLDDGLGGVVRDAATSYAASELGQMGADKVKGMFADPLAAEGASAVASGGGGAGYAGEGVFGTDHMMEAPVGAPAFSATQSQAALNGSTPSGMDPNKLSTLEKAFMLNNIVSTGFNIAGAIDERNQFRRQRASGNPFDLAMTDAFRNDRNRPSGVTSYQDYINRIG